MTSCGQKELGVQFTDLWQKVPCWTRRLDKFKNYTRQEQTTTTDKGWCGGGRLTAPGIPEVLGMSFVSSCWPQQAVVPVQTVHG
jgi:hypothetical protein